MPHLTIELPQDLEARLWQEAERAGVDAGAYVVATLTGRLSTREESNALATHDATLPSIEELERQIDALPRDQCLVRAMANTRRLIGRDRL